VLRTAGILACHREFADLARQKRAPAKRKWSGKELKEIPSKLASDPVKSLKVGKYPATSTIAYWLADGLDGLNAHSTCGETWPTGHHASFTDRCHWLLRVITQ
jgi:hypothetical protein